MEIRRLQASGDTIYENIVHVDVIITAGNRGLTIESQNNRLSRISRDVNCDLFAFLRASNIIVHILRAGVVPFPNDIPVSTAIQRSEHNETIIRLASRCDRCQRAGILGQCQTECHLIPQVTCFHRRNKDLRQHEPFVYSGTNVQPRMAIKHTIISTERPRIRRGCRCVNRSICIQSAR